MNAVTVACCQLAPKIGDINYNKQLAEQAIGEAANNGANIIVLPELIQSGYVFNDKEEARLLAETPQQTPRIMAITECKVLLDRPKQQISMRQHIRTVFRHHIQHF